MLCTISGERLLWFNPSQQLNTTQPLTHSLLLLLSSQNELFLFSHRGWGEEDAPDAAERSLPAGSVPQSSAEVIAAAFDKRAPE